MTPKVVVPVLEPIKVTRVVSTARALDTAVVPPEAIVLRVAPDETMIVGEARVQVDDPHAIVVEDGGWFGGWMPTSEAERLLSAHSTWQLPAERPCVAQGMMADAPVKLWAEADEALLLVPHVSARDLEERLWA